MIMSESSSVDEIGELVESYNYMVRKINRLLAEQAKSAEELRISEFTLSIISSVPASLLITTMDDQLEASRDRKQQPLQRYAICHVFISSR